MADLHQGTLSQGTSDVVSQAPSPLFKIAPGLRAANPKAHLAKVKLAWWYHMMGGYQIRCPELRYARTLDEVADYVDAGDLFLACSWMFEGELRCEVKWRPEMSFTGAASYGQMKDGVFKSYDTLFLCTAEALERAGDSIAAFHVVNGAMTHAAIIESNTRPAWRMRRVWKSNSQREEDTWTIDKCFASFVSIVVVA